MKHYFLWRKRIQKRYNLNKRKTDLFITPQMVAQLIRCQSEEARRLLLGVSK